MVLNELLVQSSDISKHHLQGYFYQHEKRQEFKKQWKEQLIKNQLVRQELKKIENEFSKDSVGVCLLKGFALMGDVYEDYGSRFASDVDILVKINDLKTVIEILKKQNFKVRSEKKWLGNNFKTTVTKNLGLLDITIEIHTKLFWHYDQDCFLQRPALQYSWYTVLSPEAQLIHLCGHLGFQHTFIKLFWLLDIKQYVLKYGEQINWPDFWLLAKKYSLFETCQLCLEKAGIARELQIKKSLRHRLLSVLCSSHFLISPRSYPFRYFLIKVFIKDNLLDNFRYFYQQLLFKIN